MLATGFDVWDTNMPAIEVIGRDGRNLGKWWREAGFKAYEGVTIPSFPEFCEHVQPVRMGRYVMVRYRRVPDAPREAPVDRVAAPGATTFEVTEEANDRFVDRMTDLLSDSVFTLGNCATSRSYWFNESGEAPLFRPTSVRSALKEQGGSRCPTM